MPNVELMNDGQLQSISRMREGGVVGVTVACSIDRSNRRLSLYMYYSIRPSRSAVRRAPVWPACCVSFTVAKSAASVGSDGVSVEDFLNNCYDLAQQIQT